MNGYLVLARCYMDDIPMKVFASEDEATNYAFEVGKQEIEKKAFELFGMLASDLVSLNVLEIRDGELKLCKSIAVMKE